MESPEKRWRGIKPLNKIALTNKNHEKEKEALLHDTVTGLPKHDLLKERLNVLINELNNQEKRRFYNLYAILVIALDLDNLREWNKYGHSVGNEALKKLARSIEGAIRTESGDYACRLGTNSDEFIAVLRIEKNLDESTLDEIFQKFKNKINSQSVMVEGVELPVTAAMGYAVAREGKKVNADELINTADINQVYDKDPEIKIERIEEARKRLAQRED